MGCVKARPATGSRTKIRQGDYIPPGSHKAVSFCTATGAPSNIAFQNDRVQHLEDGRYSKHEPIHQRQSALETQATFLAVHTSSSLCSFVHSQLLAKVCKIRSGDMISGSNLFQGPILSTGLFRVGLVCTVCFILPKHIQ